MRRRIWRSIPKIPTRAPLSGGIAPIYWTRPSTNPSPPATRLRWAAAANPATAATANLTREHGAPLVRHQKVVHVVRVLFFNGENPFQHAARPGIVVSEIADQFAIVIDGDAFGDQVFLDHLDQIGRLAVFGGRACRQAGRIEVGHAAQLVDALGDLVHVALLFLGVLRKFRFHTFAGD